MTEHMVFDIDDDEMGIFLDEVNEHLQAMESGILELEDATGPDTINRVFRAAHTIKALAGTVGHHRMAELTHTMENIFDAMRNNKLTPTADVADDLLETLDVLQLFRDEIANQEASDIDISDHMTRLTAILEGGSASSSAKQASNTQKSQNLVDKLSKDEVQQMNDLSEVGYIIYKAAATTEADGFAPAARLSQAAIVLMDDNEIIYQSPSMDELLNGQHNNRIDIVVASKRSKNDIEQDLSEVIDLASYEVEVFQSASTEAAKTETLPPPVPVTQAQTSAPPQKAKVKARKISPSKEHKVSVDKTVRISVERLDSLMNLVGELVTDRNRLLQIEDTLLLQRGKEGVVNDLSEMNGHLGRVVDQLQEEVMRARMLPIGSTFSKMPRLVRDVSRSAGKQINLIIEGEDTELDRSLIEYIGDPLIHLLRNSVDHGLEPPDERIAAGKDPTGTVMLTAAHEEGHIVLTIKDDGRGIDPEKVKASAVRKGMISEEEAAQMEDEEAVDLIFRPNLSTAEKVTDLSGRGVGMDVVRSNIERLSGSVVVNSTVGEGTVVRVTLPLTLAIVQTMLVSTNNISYALPLSTIIESLYLSDAAVRSVKGKKVIYWRDSVLPLIDLREQFTHPRMKNNAENRNEKAAVVTVAWGKQRVGIVVDKILGKQDIVVKSLNPIMGELPGLSGGTILGDGSIALIIDIPGLIASATQARKQGAVV